MNEAPAVICKEVMDLLAQKLGYKVIMIVCAPEGTSIASTVKTPEDSFIMKNEIKEAVQKVIENGDPRYAYTFKALKHGIDEALESDTEIDEPLLN